MAERFLPGDLDVSWCEHVGSWPGIRMSRAGFLLQDTTRELRRLAGFLGIAANPQALTQAIERSSANRLRQLEKVEHEAWVTTKGKRADIPFIAEGVAGTWKQKLAAPSMALFESRWGHLMNSFGYETRAPCSRTVRAIVPSPT